MEPGKTMAREAHNLENALLRTISTPVGRHRLAAPRRETRGRATSATLTFIPFGGGVQRRPCGDLFPCARGFQQSTRRAVPLRGWQAGTPAPPFARGDALHLFNDADSSAGAAFAADDLSSEARSHPGAETDAPLAFDLADSMWVVHGVRLG